jgi:hypothetical protein
MDNDLPDNLGEFDCGFHSRDTDIIFIDIDFGGEIHPEPPSPLLRKLGEAEREKIARWGQKPNSEQTSTEPPSPGPAMPEQGDQKNGTAG